jgi:hypothetical protein
VSEVTRFSLGTLSEVHRSPSVTLTLRSTTASGFVVTGEDPDETPLDCRYQGIDWRLQENWGCNQNVNPTGEDAFDGLTLSPYEVLFVKGKEALLHSSNSITLDAVKIASWLDWEVRHFIAHAALYYLPLHGYQAV